MRVQVVRHLHRGPFAQLRERTDGRHLVAVAAAPERKRGAPVALARDGPVDVALEPPAEPAVAHVLRVPSDRGVQLEHAITHLGGADVPGRLGVVEQRGQAPPAVRVGVLVRLLAQHAPAGGEVVDQQAVGVLHELPLGQRDRRGEEPLAVHRVGGIQTVLARGAHVVLAECRGDVHNARAVLGGDEVAHHHHMTPRDEVERRRVLHPRELRCGHHPLDHRVVTHHRGHEGLGHHQPLVTGNHHRVVHRRVDGRGLVGGECPRGRGPHQQGQSVAGGELHVDGRVRDVLVPLRDLVAAQRRAAARAVRHHLVRLVHAAGVKEGGEAPPHALDVVGVHGAVGLGGVHPEPDALGEALPLVQVLAHRLAAAGIELGDAECLDLRLAADAQLLLHLELHGQAVAVPPRLTLDVAAPHGVEAREDVLEHPRQHVVGPRASVGRGWPLVEHVRVGAAAHLHAAPEHIALAPARQHAFLHGRPSGRGPHGLPATHAAALSPASKALTPLTT